MGKVKSLKGTRVNLIWAILLPIISASFFTYIIATTPSPVFTGVITLAALVFIPTALIERKILGGVFHSIEAGEKSLVRIKLGSRKEFRWNEIMEFSISFEIADGRNIVTGGITAIIGLFLFTAYLDTGKMTYHIATADTVIKDAISFVAETELKDFVEWVRVLGHQLQESKLPNKNGFRRIQYSLRKQAVT